MTNLKTIIAEAISSKAIVLYLMKDGMRSAASLLCPDDLTTKAINLQTKEKQHIIYVELCEEVHVDAYLRQLQAGREFTEAQCQYLWCIDDVQNVKIKEDTDITKDFVYEPSNFVFDHDDFVQKFMANMKGWY